ncbi:hypothetical protein RHMOL_Rhmol08G0318200 [Rhododendron molle]|uniref:Uncharacterized protein n=1 Tax=Rhododendron molle TaxID=49168 RepID=A0ACC0MW84_RHOML|nr:hypothetical protein RHMOL_Rhmol08G0318200 [Rhododendron molle]
MKWVSGGITRGIFGGRVTTWQGKWEWTVARKGGVEEAAGEEGCGEVSQMSSRLTSESRIYADKAKDLNRQALIRKWAPVTIVLGVVILLFWVRKKIW